MDVEHFEALDQESSRVTPDEFAVLRRRLVDSDEYVERLDPRQVERVTGRRDLALGYGEVLQPLLDHLYYVLDLDSTDAFIDIGSGVGNAVIYMAARAGTRSVGFEIVPALHEIAVRNAISMRASIENMKKTMGSMMFIPFDVLKFNLFTANIGAYMKAVDGKVVVFINNVLFRDVLTKNMVRRLLQQRIFSTGDRLVLMKPLLWTRVIDDQDIFDRVTYQQWHTSPNDSVSWTDKPQYPIIYTIEDTPENYSIFDRQRERESYRYAIRRRPSSPAERPN